MKYHRQFLAISTIFFTFTAVIALWASPLARTQFADTFSIGIDPQKARDPISELKEVSPAPSSTTDAFHFLEPLAPNLGDPEKFDDTLLPFLTIEICEVDGSNCPVVKIMNNESSGSEQLRIGTTGRNRHYMANWDTQRTGINNTLTYRVRVVVGDFELGSIDLAPPQYISFGRTWPIKFLIERDPALRIQILSAAGETLWEVADNLRTDFGICDEELSHFLLTTFPGATAEEVEMVTTGVCQDVIIPTTTKIADRDTRSSLVSFDPSTGQMIFSNETSLLKDLKINDVIASTSSSAAPYGYLRKVTAILKNRGRYTVETVQAKLTEAISQGSLDVTGDLLPPNPVAPNFTRFSNITGNKSFPTEGVVIDEGESFTFGPHHIDVTINFDGSEDGVEGTGSVRVIGDVFFDARYNVGLGIRPCVGFPPACVDRFEAWAGAKQRSKLRVEGNFDGTILKERVIHPVPLRPIWVWIGPLPVVLVPEMNVVLGLDGDAHLDFVFDANANSTLKVGAKWLNPSYGGNGWNDISEIDLLSGRVNEATLNANMRLEAFAKLDTKIKLYGIVGPGMEGSVGIEADVATNRQPLWKLRGHVASAAKFEIGLAQIIDVGVYREPILNRYFHIAQSVNSPPDCSGRTDVIPADIDARTPLGPRINGSWGYFTCTDPEGEDIDYEAESSNPIDIIQGMTATFGSAGERTVTVTATDASGASEQITLRFEARNSLPVVTAHAATDAVPVGVQYFLNALIYDWEEQEYLPCYKLTSLPTGPGAIVRYISFSVVAPDTVVYRGDAFNCTAEVIFRQPGSRSVTIVATDRHGGTSSETVNVNVTGPPSNQAPVINANEDSFDATARSQIFKAEADTSIFCLAGQLCPISNGETVFSGVGSSPANYDLPLILGLSATDPEGPAPTVRWWCKNGTSVTEAANIGNGSFSCNSFTPGNPIFVWATVSDGTTTVYSQMRNYYMAYRTN